MLLERVQYAGRRIIPAGVMLIVGLSRLGLLSQGPDIALPDILYGWSLAVLAAGVIATAFCWRMTLLGRVLAGLGACVMLGLATDFWLSIHGITTALILSWLAAWLVVEAVTNHVG